MDILKNIKILFDSDNLYAIGINGNTFILAGQFVQRITVNKLLNYYFKFNTVKNERLKDGSKHNPFIEYETKFKKFRMNYIQKKQKKLREKDLILWKYILKD